MKNLVLRLLLYLSLIGISVVILTPLVWLIAASFKTEEDFFHYTFFPIEAPAWQTLSDEGLWEYLKGFEFHLSLVNFRKLFEQIPFWRYLMNSVFVTSATVMIQLFFSSLGGFALAKYDFRGKKLIMVVMLASMVIPGQVLLAPLYELIFRIRLIDSYAGLILPGMVSVLGTFLFRQSMLHISDDLLQAARIDGCGEFRIYWSIVMPVCRPMIGAFCLIAFMGTWNNFLWPQIILHSHERFTLPIALTQMVGMYHQDYGVLMAGTLLSILPVVVLFFILQKQFISGLTAGSIKG